MSVSISVEEYLKEFERLSANQTDEGMTTEELKNALGLSLVKTQHFIRDGVRAGRLILGDRFIQKDWDGRSRHLKVYRVAP